VCGSGTTWWARGQPVVCLHGWPADHEHVRHDLEPVFRDRPGWQRIYLDLPGMGRSVAPDRIRSHVELAEFLPRLVARLVGDRQFAVVGASYGGYLARWLTHLCPDRVDGFFVYVPVIRTVEGRQLPAPHAVAPNPQLTAQLAEDEQLWASAQTVHTNESLQLFRTVVKPAIARADPEFLARLDASPYPPAPGPLRPLAVPALIICGRQDSWCGYADQWEVLDDYPRATFAVLDRAAHGVASDRRELFEALVLDWLDRIEAEATAHAT
jgi:pimeloyl-ACP methyl ester carboxylesterase